MRSQLDKAHQSLFQSAIHPWRMAGAVMLLLFVGCGRGPMGDVSGRLTLQGEPVTQGSVVFFREAGVPVGTAELTPTGEFRLRERLPAGTYLVAFHFDDGAVAGAPEPVSATPGPQVPSQYWVETTSGLTVDVQVGTNTFELNME